MILTKRLPCLASLVVGFTALSSSADYWVAADYQGYMRKLDLTTGAAFGIVEGAGSAAEIEATRDGFVYGSFGDQIRKFSLSGGLVQSINLPARARDIAFGPDGKLYIALIGDAFGGGALAIHRFDPATNSLSGPFNTSALGGSPIGIAFGPDNDLFIALDTRYSGTGAARVIRLDGETGALMGTVTSTGVDVPQSIAFSPDRSRFYVGNQGSARITEYLNDGTFIQTLVEAAGNTQGLTFMPDGDLAWGNGYRNFLRYDFASQSVSVFATGFNFAMGLAIVPEPIAGILFAAPALMVSARRRTS